MAAGARDEQFAAFVVRERPLLQGAAYLLSGDPRVTEDMVQAVLARRYEHWRGFSDARSQALSEIAGPQTVRLPWAKQPRVELLDGAFVSAAAAPVVVDLSQLPREQRAALVLERFAGLPPGQLGAVLGRSPEQALELTRKARAALAEHHSDRLSDASLTRELQEAVPDRLRQAGDPALDVANGRRLLRRQWSRRAFAAAAALVIAVLGIPHLLPGTASAPVPPPAMVPSTTTPPAEPPKITCDPISPACRATVMQSWRSQLSDVTASYVDPQQRYFRGYQSGPAYLFATPSFWTGKGGLLAFDLSRERPGATEVYLQVATDYRHALTCGATTHQRCVSLRFLEGNRYTLSDSTTVAEGMEVQYSPNGSEVVTVIARNSGQGPSWPIPRSRLIELVQDPRLRLPNL